jgi:hypothetical protein
LSTSFLPQISVFHHVPVADRVARVDHGNFLASHQACRPPVQLRPVAGLVLLAKSARTTLLIQSRGTSSPPQDMAAVPAPHGSWSAGNAPGSMPERSRPSPTAPSCTSLNPVSRPPERRCRTRGSSGRWSARPSRRLPVRLWWLWCRSPRRTAPGGMLAHITGLTRLPRRAGGGPSGCSP